MRKCFPIIILITFSYCYGQYLKADSIIEAAHRKIIDSLHQLLPREKSDTGRARLLRFIGVNYLRINKDSSLTYNQQALRLSQGAKDFGGETQAVRQLADVYSQSGDYSKAIELALDNLQKAEERKDTLNILWATRSVWRSYHFMLNDSMALVYARKAKLIVHSGFFKKEEERKRFALIGYMVANSVAYEGLKQLDSALYYGHLAYETARSLKDTQLLGITVLNLGNFYSKVGKSNAAFSFYRMAIPFAVKSRRSDIVAGSHLGMARLFAEQKQNDSAIHYGKLALKTFHHTRSPVHELLAIPILVEAYARQNQFDSAYKYQTLTLVLKDSLYDKEKVSKALNIGFNETLRREQLEQEKREAEQRYNTRLQTYGIVGGLLLLLSVAFFMYRLKQVKHETQLKAVFNKKIHQIEMRALRAQMNPHFIFNCLNSINRYIVKSDHKTASNYLTKFARLIRLILDNSASEYITLDKEIQTLQLYVEMEVLRFDKVFDYSIEVDEGILPETINIPPMLLQPYVENAIWHGLLHKEAGGGKLWVRFIQPNEKSLIAEIEDNGIGRQRAKELKSKEVIRKKSYGMQISKDRIFLINELYNTNANVQVKDLTDEEGNAKGTNVTVELPVRNS